MIRHVADQHPDKYNCGKCQKDFHTSDELNKHAQEIDTQRQELDECNCTKCPMVLKGKDKLKSHMNEAHISCDKCTKEFASAQDLRANGKEVLTTKALIKNTLLLSDSNTKYQKPRQTGGHLFTPGYTHPRSGRAYCSTKDLPNSRYPDNNIEDKVREQLQIREQSHLVFGALGNDITNIDYIADRAEQ